MFALWNKHNTIYDIIKPFYTISRFIGLASYTIIGNVTDGIVQTKLVDIIPLMGTLGIQLYLLYFNLQNDLKLNRTSSAIVNQGGRLATGLSLVNLVFATIINHYFKHTVWGFIAGIHKCDLQVIYFNPFIVSPFQMNLKQILLQLEALNSKVDLTSIARKVLVFLSITVSFLFACLSFMIYAVISDEEQIKKFEGLLTFCFINASYTIFILNFIVMTNLLSTRFRQINICLR